MPRRRKSLPCLGIVCWAAWTAGATDSQVAVAAEVSLRTTDNRTLRGEVDARTDQHQLWIRRQTEQIVLATPVGWTSIASAQLDGVPIDVAELARMANQLASPAPTAFLAQQTLAPPESLEVLPPPSVDYPAAPSHSRTAPSRVASVEIEAWLVNFDRDVEPDGLEVAVAAVDTHGRHVAVRGDLTARLIVERNDFRTGRARVDDVQRWSQPIAAGDFVDGVAFYRLPFRTVRPEWDLELRSQGLLHVRLGVTGQGNYEASVPVSIRHFNPVRDQLQHLEGSRFARDELTSRVRRRSFPPTRGGAPPWTPYHVIGVGPVH
jgi:hypothetical protein